MKSNWHHAWLAKKNLYKHMLDLGSVKKMRTTVGCILLMTSCAAELRSDAQQIAGTDVGLADGLMLYCSFDRRTPEPDWAAGSAAVWSAGPYRFVPGPSGHALSVVKGKAGGVLYDVYSNAHHSGGTIAARIRPTFLAQPDGTNDVLHWAHAGLRVSAGTLTWYSHLLKSADRTSRWFVPFRVADVSSWRADRWVHIACSWVCRDGEATISIFLDGSQAWSERLNGEEVRVFKRKMTTGTGPVTTGKLDPDEHLREGTSLDVDSFGLWERPLTDAEVRALAAGQAPTLRSRSRVRPFDVLRAQTQDPQYMHVAGKAVEYDLRLASRLDEERPLTFRFVDFYDRTVGEPVRCILRPDTELTHTGLFEPQGTGVFKLVVSGVDPGSEGRFEHDLFSVSVLPPLDYQTGDGVDSFFGNHFDVGDAAGGYPSYVRLARMLGVRWVRGLNFMQLTWWPHVEPERGRFVWRDDVVDSLRAEGMQILGVLYGTPRWASARGQAVEKGNSIRSYCQFPPDDMDDYRNYVYRTVKHYRGRIRHWEVWNEPWGNEWRDTPQAYVALCQATREAARRADPEAVVVGGGGAQPWAVKFFADAFEAGLNRYQDVFSIHGYSDEVTPIAFELFGKQASFVDAFRELMRRHGGTVRPIWNTEMGSQSGSFLRHMQPAVTARRVKAQFRKAAFELVKYEVSQMAGGIDKHFHYYLRRFPRRWHEGTPSDGNMLEHIEFRDEPESWSDVMEWIFDLDGPEPRDRVGGGGVKPFGVAYAVLARWLDGARFVKKGAVAGHANWFLFRRPDDSAVLVCWGPDPQTETQWDLPLPATGCRIYNVMGNPLPLGAGPKGLAALDLSTEPVYVAVPGLDADAVAAALEASIDRPMDE